MDISINFSNTTQASKESTPGTLDVTKLPLLFSLRCRQELGTKAKINTAFAKATAHWRMREELRSSSQPAWLRSFECNDTNMLRSRACLQTAPSAVAQGLWRDTCSSSHLDFLKL